MITEKQNIIHKGYDEDGQDTEFGESWRLVRANNKDPKDLSLLSRNAERFLLGVPVWLLRESKGLDGVCEGHF